MRQCPTFEGVARPLIAHRIDCCQCFERQRGFYHKCHRCVYRGKPASYAFDEASSPQVGEAKIVELPRPAQPVPTA